MYPTLRALGAVVFASGLVASAAGAATPPKRAAALTVQDKRDLAAVLTMGKPGQPVALDMSDPAEHRFFLRQMQAAGFSPARYPQMYRVTEAAAVGKLKAHALDRRSLKAFNGVASADSIGPIQTLTSVGTNDGTNYAASALSSVPKTPYFSALVVQLYDANNNPLGQPASVTSATQPATSLNAVATGVSSTSFAPVQGVATYFWQDQYGSPHHGVVEATITSAPTNITNLAPMPGAGQTVIKLCLGRTGTDCSYSPAGGTGSNVLMPIQGSITFGGAISTDPTTQFSLITMARPDPSQGGGCTIASTSNFFGDPNTIISGGTISWNLPAAQFPPAQGCLTANATAIYTFTVGLSVASQATFVAITNDPTTDPTDPYFKIIPQLQVFFSCLAEGTRITLDDGSTIPIETLKAGQQVLVDREGRAEKVANKLKGTEAVPMVRLLTANGRNLLLTDGHPVITPDGPVLAGMLHIRQKVMTDKGADTLVSVRREMFAKPVWNLNVGTPPSDLNNAAVRGKTFFANGILVGDNVMQFVENRRNQRAVAMRIAAHAPAAWKRDIASAMTDAD